VACPYFYPKERTLSIGWAFPHRLPLGSGFCGTCRAGDVELTPSDSEIRDLCNLGYSGQCAHLPQSRKADCVRVSVAKDHGDRILLHYIYEKEHAPVEHGMLEYQCSLQRWVNPLTDVCVQRQAECFLAIYLEKRPRLQDR
jgi:hypothetical protein